MKDSKIQEKPLNTQKLIKVHFQDNEIVQMSSFRRWDNSTVPI